MSDARVMTAERLRTVNVGPIERDEPDGTREYIPLPDGWEIQTKGRGSSYRLLDRKTGQRHSICAADASFIYDFVTRMAKDVHEASRQAVDTIDALQATIARQADALRVADVALRPFAAFAIAWGKNSLEGWQIAEGIAHHIKPASVAHAAIASALTKGGDGWQPIGTAPKDGTAILLWSAIWKMSWGIQIGRFNGGVWVCNDGELSENERDEDGLLIGPTYWRPLPAPPVDAGDA